MKRSSSAREDAEQLVNEEEHLPESSPSPSYAADAINILLNRTPKNLLKRIFLAANCNGNTILHLACSRGDMVLVELLLERLDELGQNLVRKALGVKDRLGRVPFLSAVAADARDVVMHLLVSRSNTGVDYKSWFEGCPLTIAASNYSVEMIRLLLETCGISHSRTHCLDDPVAVDLNRALVEIIARRKANDEAIDGEDDSYEIISLLIEHGANPHMTTPISLRQTSGDSPLSAAVSAGDSMAAKYMTDVYLDSLKTRRAIRRIDPLLRSQPESYFRVLEQKENDAIHSSLQMSLSKSLFLHLKDSSPSRSSFGMCALTLYKRANFLSQTSLQWLEQSMKNGPQSNLSNLTSNDSVESYYFEAPIIQYGMSDSIRKNSKITPYRDDGANHMEWSAVLSTLEWIRSGRLNCKWLQDCALKADTMCNFEFLQSDEFYIVSEGERLLAHKSICSAKCFKLAAAIRFYEANTQAAQFHNDRLLIHVDLPSLTCKMLLSHIYHGSMAFGFLKSSLQQCNMVLEMALVAEEYLCPTLMLECEIRLLMQSTSTSVTHGNNGPAPCICVNCMGARVSTKDACSCPIHQLCLEDAENNCIENKVDESICKPIGVASLKASNVISHETWLITPESAMNVLAVAEQLGQSSSCQDGFYALKFCRSGAIEGRSTMMMPTFGGWDIDLKTDTGAGCLYTPFAAARITAVMIMLRDFSAVVKSESYLMQVRGDIEDMPDPSLALDSTKVQDEDAALLLRTCLEEFVQSPLNDTTSAQGPDAVDSRVSSKR